MLAQETWFPPTALQPTVHNALLRSLLGLTWTRSTDSHPGHQEPGRLAESINHSRAKYSGPCQKLDRLKSVTCVISKPPSHPAGQVLPSSFREIMGSERLNNLARVTPFLKSGRVIGIHTFLDSEVHHGLHSGGVLHPVENNQWSRETENKHL